MNLNKEQKESLLSLINKELSDWQTGFNTELLCDIKEALTITDVVNCKITALVTYSAWEEAPHYMLDDTKKTMTKIVEVKRLIDINEMFTNLIDVKILK